MKTTRFPSWSLLRCSARLVALALAWPLVSLASAQGSQAASEKRMLGEFQEAFDSSEPAERVKAVTALGEGTRSLEDKGSSKAVAKALAKGLADPDMDVASAAVWQFGYGREVETTLSAFAVFLEEHFAELEHAAGKSSAEARETVSRGSVLFVNGCRVLATYRDDRSSVFLAKRLASLPPLATGNDLATRLAGPLAACALDLGTFDVATAAVRLTKTLDGPKQAAAGRPLHDALTEFATRSGAAGPEFGDTYAADWQAWLAKHGPALPKKLGKLATPPAEGPVRAMDGMPGKGR